MEEQEFVTPVQAYYLGRHQGTFANVGSAAKFISKQLSGLDGWILYEVKHEGLEKVDDSNVSEAYQYAVKMVFMGLFSSLRPEARQEIIDWINN